MVHFFIFRLRPLARVAGAKNATYNNSFWRGGFCPVRPKTRHRTFLCKYVFVVSMQDLTLLFFLLMIGVYLLQILSRRAEKRNEMIFLTILMSICAISCILMDEECTSDMIGMLPIFPSVFILLHSIIGLLGK